MNTIVSDDLRALATIDPAGPPDPDAHRSAGAQALLASITAAPPQHAASPRVAAAPDELAARRTERPAASTRPVRAARPIRRWSMVAAAAAAVTVGIVATPSLVGGDAYGSWTDVPAAPSVADASDAAASCRDWWTSATEGGPTGSDFPSAEAIQQTDLVLAEQRGDFTYTVLSDGTWSMDCLVHGGLTLPWGFHGSAGATSLAAPRADVPADGVAAVSMGAMDDDSSDSGLVLMMYGQVGTNVQDVVAHVPGAGAVAATVTDGYFAAWAPGLTEAGFADPGVALTLYLTDGTEVELTSEQVLQGVAG